MPQHKRDSENESNADHLCAIRWCDGLALDSEYCWKCERRMPSQRPYI